MLSSSLLLAAVASSVAAQLSDLLSTPYLNLTALSAAKGESVFECWQLASPFKETAVPGIAGSLKLSLGELGDASYDVIPARFDGGFHHAPAFQYVLFISGLAHISLHAGDEEVWVHGGKYGLLIAADTADRSAHGHRTRYPSASDTVSLEIPIRDRDSFKYKVLHSGACHESETTGI